MALPGTAASGTTDWNFADTWETVAAHRPDGPAIIQGDVRLSWADFDARANGVAAALLAAGLGRQAKVAQYLYNGPEYLESVFAAFKAGLAPVNTNYRYTEDELVYLWDNAEAEAVVFDAEFTERIDAVRDRAGQVRLWLQVGGDAAACPDWATPYEQVAAAGRGLDAVRAPWGRSGDDLLLIYTGGTTGMPKGVMWRQDDLWVVLNRTAALRYPENGSQADVGRLLDAPARHPVPRLLPGPPLMHGTGLFSALGVMASGGVIVLLPGRRFSAASLLDTVAAEKVGQISIVGDAFAKAILAELDAHPGAWDLSSLWLMVSSGVMWSAEVKAGLLRHLPKLLMVDQLGSSEALGLGNSRSRAGEEAETAGFQLGPDARVITEEGVDVVPGSGQSGLLALRGRGPIGYYRDPAKSDATFRLIGGERWAIPGDWATVAEDGTLKLLGRGSVCINTGGEKVFPEEVEEVIKTAPDVADAVVVGVPDERFGEAVVAVVEAAAGAEVDAEALISWVKVRLAGYKAPRRIIGIDTIGRAPNGKVDYRRLKALAAEVVAAG
jgi:acyl-CoA synthetase (AMP-forming)/AMP-acid ligase II